MVTIYQTDIVSGQSLLRFKWFYLWNFGLYQHVSPIFDFVKKIWFL